MKFFLQIVSIVRSEANFLLLYPKKLLSGLVLIFVPALYCILYITSVWDPETKTNALPVAVVNLDEGVLYRTHQFNVGWEIATQLEDSGRFGFVMFSDEQKARSMVREGKLAFAVIIPREFSASSVPGADAGAGKIVIYASQGNNFETATIAKHFAETLKYEINEKLNERRWVMVLHTAAESERQNAQLRKELARLQKNAQVLGAESRPGGLGRQRIERLAGEIDGLGRQLPGKLERLDGSPEGLASSVAPVLEIDAPVQNSGSGFASNIVPGALWLGAAVAAILIHVRVLSGYAQALSRPVQVLGKLFLPAGVVLLQSLFVFITVRYVLEIHVVSPWAFVLTLILSSLAFLFIVFFLIKAFGDAGEGITMFLLAVQLSCSGGILPVELSGGWFAKISPWLPLTWVVESIKAVMFGAFGGAWLPPLLLLLLAALACFTLSCFVGSWRFVKTTKERSATEF
jgi:YhgE/Pip-like protein